MAREAAAQEVRSPPDKLDALVDGMAEGVLGLCRSEAVGLHCREVIISLSQQVYNPDKYPTLDGVKASETDAKRMLDAYLAVELGGGPNEQARKHARASLDLANQLQHRRTATFREAALCAEATTALVNIVSIVAGRRDP